MPYFCVRDMQSSFHEFLSQDGSKGGTMDPVGSRRRQHEITIGHCLHICRNTTDLSEDGTPLVQNRHQNRETNRCEQI